MVLSYKHSKVLICYTFPWLKIVQLLYTVFLRRVASLLEGIWSTHNLQFLRYLLDARFVGGTQFSIMLLANAYVLLAISSKTVHV